MGLYFFSNLAAYLEDRGRVVREIECCVASTVGDFPDFDVRVMQDMVVDLVAKIVREVAERCFLGFPPTQSGCQHGWRDVTIDFKNEGVEYQATHRCSSVGGGAHWLSMIEFEDNSSTCKYVGILNEARLDFKSNYQYD
jgi:hypothetical protein